MSLPATHRAESLYFAQPYNPDAHGFYFADYEEYLSKSAKLKDVFGHPVEEFEIQYIDGDDLECALFKAVGVYQSNLEAYLDFVDQADESHMIELIVADDAGYPIDLECVDFDLDIYPNMTLRELAEQFLDDGLFGDIPDSLRFYIDEEKVARDLAFDYTEITICGVGYTYRAS